MLASRPCTVLPTDSELEVEPRTVFGAVNLWAASSPLAIQLPSIAISQLGHDPHSQPSTMPSRHLQRGTPSSNSKARRVVVAQILGSCYSATSHRHNGLGLLDTSSPRKLASPSADVLTDQ